MGRAAAVAACALAAALGSAPATAAAADCPTAPDPSALPTAAQLKEMNTYEDKLGVRPTGSPAHAKFVKWIQDRLKEIPGVQLDQIDYPIHRWTSTGTSLTIQGDGPAESLPIPAAIPYSQPSGVEPVSAPLTLIPDDQEITADNAAGKIVVRPAPAGSVTNAAFLLPVVVWEPPYDPDNTIDPSQSLYGDFINYGPRVADLRNAAAAGAKGILFVKDLPRAQLKDHYEPYEGEEFGVPGLFLGSDEGKKITDALEAGKQLTGQLVNRAKVEAISTPTIVATVPGQSKQRIVIDSHTDGTNAVEDNGPVAMIAMARYFSELPAECRPRTIQFDFATAHFYQRLVDPAIRNGGAWQIAQQLDKDYDKGTVSAVVVLEHLGALDYERVPRSDGGPGEELKQNGQPAVDFIGITPSPSLVSAVDSVVRSYDLRRSILLQGSDLPGSTVPQHCSFGGEGSPYNINLLPTVAVISPPQTLYDPAFGLEGIDFDVMHRQVLAFTELLNRMGTMSQEEVAGQVTAERAQRAAGATTCPQEVEPPPKGASPPPLTAPEPQPGKPPVKGCTKSRKLTFRVHQPKRGRVTKVRVYVGKKLVKTVRGRRVKKVTIKRPKRANFTVKVVASTTTGSRTISVRHYRGCKKTHPTTHVVRT